MTFMKQLADGKWFTPLECVKMTQHEALQYQRAHCAKYPEVTTKVLTANGASICTYSPKG